MARTAGSDQTPFAPATSCQTYLLGGTGRTWQTNVQTAHPSILNPICKVISKR